MTKLCVLQVLPALESGGVERGTLEIGRAVVAAGHRSLVMSGGGRLVYELEDQGSEHFTWPIGNKSLWTFRLVGPLRRFLKEQQVDLIDVRSRMPAWVVWRAWLRMPPATRPQLITSVHGFNSVGRYSAILTRGERVVTVSRSLKHFLLDHYSWLRDEKVSVIHRGVATDLYNPMFRPSSFWLEQWQATYPKLTGKMLITLPGRITRLKGHIDALAILRELLKNDVPAHLVIAGGTDPRKKSYQQELENLIAAQDLSGHATFTGQRADLREILSVSDVVLSLSAKPESFGRTKLEALSLGRPVLGYDHGGVGEQLSALLPEGRIPVGDIAAAVERLCAWSRQGSPKPRWPHCWDLHTMTERTIELYEQLAYKGKGGVNHE